jgi:hypothetical protein
VRCGADNPRHSAGHWAGETNEMSSVAVVRKENTTPPRQVADFVCTTIAMLRRRCSCGPRRQYMDCRTPEMPIIATSINTTITRQRRALLFGSSPGIAISIWPTSEHGPTSASCMRISSHILTRRAPALNGPRNSRFIDRPVSYAVPACTRHTDCMLRGQGRREGHVPHRPSIVARILSCAKG